MQSIAVPTLLRKPEIMELPGVPETYCDIAIVVGGEETMRVLLAVERSGGYELVGRVHMPRAGFRRSLLWTIVDHGTGWRQ